MNFLEFLETILLRFPEIQEIPAPEPVPGAPASEPKPYRDLILHLRCPAADWYSFAEFLRNDERLCFDFLTFLTAVDPSRHAKTPAVELDLVAHLYSTIHRHRLVVKVSVSREESELSSVVPLWPGADWQEREIYDMFGIRFKGHPNCTRILMWEGFPGWPLRKDYQHTPDKYDD